MHEVALTDRAVDDPGRADVDTDPATQVDDATTTYFDDEQPESGDDTADDVDEEPDLEQILESQHYAFEEGEA